MVQLYQFMLRVVKNPCTVFTASEKKELCNLMVGFRRAPYLLTGCPYHGFRRETGGSLPNFLAADHRTETMRLAVGSTTWDP